jgi:hypothetical protein
LDFGIYRIMNRGRDVIKRFIAQDLPKSVAKELDRRALADRSRAVKELKEVAEQIAQALGKEALEVRTASWRLAKTTCGRHRTHHRKGRTPQSWVVS